MLPFMQPIAIAELPAEIQLQVIGAAGAGFPSTTLAELRLLSLAVGIRKSDMGWAGLSIGDQ